MDDPEDMDRFMLVLAWSLDRLEGLEALVEFLLARAEDHEQDLNLLQQRLLALEGPARQTERRA